MDSHFFYRNGRKKHLLKSEIKAEITFIFSNEHVSDLNVQYDLIWWEYA